MKQVKENLLEYSELNGMMYFTRRIFNKKLFCEFKEAIYLDCKDEFRWTDIGEGIKYDFKTGDFRKELLGRPS